jgi:hypothetical protein
MSLNEVAEEGRKEGGKERRKKGADRLLMGG